MIPAPLKYQCCREIVINGIVDNNIPIECIELINAFRICKRLINKDLILVKDHFFGVNKTIIYKGEIDQNNVTYIKEYTQNSKLIEYRNEYFNITFDDKHNEQQIIFVIDRDGFFYSLNRLSKNTYTISISKHIFFNLILHKFNQYVHNKCISRIYQIKQFEFRHGLIEDSSWFCNIPCNKKSILYFANITKDVFGNNVLQLVIWAIFNILFLFYNVNNYLYVFIGQTLFIFAMMLFIAFILRITPISTYYHLRGESTRQSNIFV